MADFRLEPCEIFEPCDISSPEAKRKALAASPDAWVFRCKLCDATKAAAAAKCQNVHCKNCPRYQAKTANEITADEITADDTTSDDTTADYSAPEHIRATPSVHTEEQLDFHQPPDPESSLANDAHNANNAQKAKSGQEEGSGRFDEDVLAVTEEAGIELIQEKHRRANVSKDAAVPKRPPADGTGVCGLYGGCSLPRLHHGHCQVICSEKRVRDKPTAFVAGPQGRKLNEGAEEEKSGQKEQSGRVANETNTASPSDSLQKRFSMLVMCEFTPRSPSQLPTAQWTSYQELLRLIEPHATQTEVRHFGVGNLKQLIIQWYKDHPAFAGLAPAAWCKRCTKAARTQVYKFCFEYTPGGR